MNRSNYINQPLRDYQNIAIEKWKQNNYVGLFEMATGTGKTITALSCAKYLLDSEGCVHLFILVPTIDLATQWMKETRRYLLRNIILAHSKNSNWYNESFAAVNYNSNYNYCIIATYATFLTKRFQNIIRSAPTSSFLIADEVHNFGTEKHAYVYPKNIERKLGLSATPIRYFDDIGTNAILKYFNAKNGITFKYNLQDAINNGFLCKYYYFPVLVTLEDDELEAYKILSKRLAKYFNIDKSKFLTNPAVTGLLLKRKKIIHNASRKFEAFKQILSFLTSRRANLRYLLVYVPEGGDNKIDSDDHKLIDAYSKIINDDFGLSQHQFIGLTQNRENILNQFSKGEIAVLTAMKCLDEGVDINRAEIAIFCSSSGNPIQIIDRRGRILGTHPDKLNATIYDLIVVPAMENDSLDNIQMEKSILQSELRRVREFAKLALNHYQALEKLEEVANKLDLDIYSQEIS